MNIISPHSYSPVGWLLVKNINAYTSQHIRLDSENLIRLDSENMLRLDSENMLRLDSEKYII